MPLHNTRETWGSVSKFFHWAIVLLLIGQGILGLVMDDLPRDGFIRPMPLHKSIGVLILMLAVFRLLWVLFNGRPAPAPGVTRTQQTLARLGHILLYALLFAVPISGYLLSVYGGRPVEFFGLFQLPMLVGENEAAKEAFEERHEILFWILTAVAVGHALVAMYHHMFQRDATLVRMLPGNRRAPDRDNT